MACRSGRNSRTKRAAGTLRDRESFADLPLPRCRRSGSERFFVDACARQARGLVGPTGSGKSTLIQLSLCFCIHPGGVVMLGGRPPYDYAGEDPIRWIAVVTQQVHLFNASIRENLLLADLYGDPGDLVRVCRIAQVHAFITGLPDGKDTWVGETGVRL